MSDLGELADDISNGEVFHLENISFLTPDFDLYYNQKTAEYIGVYILIKDM